MVGGKDVKIPVPHEQYDDDLTREGEWIEFRRLSATALQKARDKRAKQAQSQAASMLRDLGPSFFKAMREGNVDERENLTRAMDELQYHLDNFDIPTLLVEGIMSWSYEESAPGEFENPADGLDERTARWAATTIVELTRPPTEEEEGEA